jgi:D-serine deaminase-like pyridoxal phosphate-dependent protein
VVATKSRAVSIIVAPTQELDTPAMVIDEAILHQNISEMQALANSNGVNLRPHIKTHKMPEIARQQIASGAVGITCAKLGEAEVMVDGGVTDVLIAYPIVGAIKIKRLLALMERAHMVTAFDSREAAQAMSDAMVAAGRRLDVYTEVNTGQNHAGVWYGDEAVALALDMAKMPGLHLIGVMNHEGQANSAPPETIKEVAIAAGKNLVATADAIRSHGIELPVVSTGSTPAAAYTPTVPGVTEMRPGTYVFRDASGFRYGVYGVDRCAARILATVVSHPTKDRCIVDAGSKTLALDKNPGHPGHGYIVGHPDSIIGALREEHGIVTIAENDPGFAIGDRFEIIPNHICPSINLMNEVFVVRDGHLVATWTVAARGKIR